MDLNFYSELSGGSPSNVDSEYLNGQAYGGYSEENKVTLNFLKWIINLNRLKMLLMGDSLDTNQLFQFSEGSDSYLSMGGQGHHPFLSAAVSRFTEMLFIQFNPIIVVECLFSFFP